MLTRISAALLLSTTVLAGAALAQQPATSTDSPAPASPPITAPATGGTTVPAAADKFVTDQGTGEFRASKFVGLDIYGSDGEKIGDIADLLIDKTGQAKAAVIGVGGFLGIGQKNVAVPFASIEWVSAKPPTKSAAGAGPTTTGSTTPAPAGASSAPAAPARSPDDQAAYNGYPDHGMVKLTKAELQNAPSFKYYADTHGSTGVSNATPPTTPRQ